MKRLETRIIRLEKSRQNHVDRWDEYSGGHGGIILKEMKSKADVPRGACA